MKKMVWTKQQNLAISARDSDIVVTASAGTGKTAVLSGRCVHIISDKSICPNVFGVLVLTFTDAAAEEMRSRIASQLKAASLQTGDRHLRHQLLMLQGADISTIHSFCKRLITENFYALGLDPTFGIIDSDEQQLLKAQALEKTLEWAWNQNNLQQALGQLFTRRKLGTSEDFTSKIIELSDFLDNVISRESWRRRAIMLNEPANALSGDLGQKQKKIVADKLAGILNRLERAGDLYNKLEPNGQWRQKLDIDFLSPVRQCRELITSGRWKAAAEMLINFKKPTVRKPGQVEEPFDEIIKTAVKSALDDFVKIASLAVLNPDYAEKIGSAVSLQTRVLVELVERFEKFYGQAKQNVDCLDFADLEHYALKLLTEPSADDVIRPSSAAMLLRQRYRQIFVDEYQDINPVQEAILKAITEGDNLFVVGDVKQSIYGFRGAVPTLFLQRIQDASAESGHPPTSLRVDLNTNWRSNTKILEFVNKLFAKIMTASVCDMDYDESAWLKGAVENAAAAKEPAVELHILDETRNQHDEDCADDEQEQGSTNFSSRQRQAMMIARRIKEMVGEKTGKAEFEIFDKDLNKYRPVEYRDIVILMRSPAKRVNDYIEVLRLASVPVSCQNSTGYFEATEISDCLCLLKVLDNPQRDIELAAVLRSPFFGVTDSELAKIRVFGGGDNSDKNFHECVLCYCRSGPDGKLAEKLSRILADIERWRGIAKKGRLADLLWQIYRQTRYLSFVSALANGRQRRANLLKLHDRAIQFEGFVSSGGIPSLTRFVEFIEKLQQSGQDWASAEPVAQAQNAVRIISIHKSKGLEFPVVFLAELNSRFNKQDTIGDCLADIENTVGLRIIDPASNTRASSLAHQVIAEKKVGVNLAEEMRILYVALTRARERLILTASQSGDCCRPILRDGLIFAAEQIADWQLRSSKSPLDWVLYGLSGQRNLHEAFETGLNNQAIDDSLFSLRLYNQDELNELSRLISQGKMQKAASCLAKKENLAGKTSESPLLEKIKESLEWQYDFGEAPLIPAKQSVSQLTHSGDEYRKKDYSGALGRKPKVLLSEKDFAGTCDGLLFGSAVHLVISRLDLAQGVTLEAIEQAKARLAAEGAITGAIAEKIDNKSIAAFFDSPLGRHALDSKNTVYREWQFSFSMPASELHKTEKLQADETVIIQGIIDMLIQTPGGLIVIDFKTDRLNPAVIAQRAEIYKPQLELYSRAASAILKTGILGKWLYFLNSRTEFEIR